MTVEEAVSCRCGEIIALVDLVLPARVIIAGEVISSGTRILDAAGIANQLVVSVISRHMVSSPAEPADRKPHFFISISTIEPEERCPKSDCPIHPQVHSLKDILFQNNIDNTGRSVG